MKRRLVTILLTVLFLTPACLMAAKVFFVHGGDDDEDIDSNREAVDVTVGDACVLTNVVFSDFLGPITLEPGQHDIQVRLSDGNCSGALVAAQTMGIAIGESASVVLYLGDEEQPKIRKFASNVPSLQHPSPDSDNGRMFEPRTQLQLGAFRDLDIGRVLKTRRRPVVAVVPLGPESFAVGFVKDGFALPEGTVAGPIVYRVFNLRTGLQGAETVVSNNGVGFIRSTMDPAVPIADCPPVVAGPGRAPDIAGRLTADLALRQGTINYLAFDEFGDLSNPPASVKLLRFRTCADGTKTRLLDVGAGRKPSVAIGRDNIGQPLILVVYGRDDRSALWGRFFDINGEPKGDALELARYPRQFYTFGTDIIWNSRSHRFIATIHVKGGNIPEAADGCRIYNLAVTPDGVSSLPKERGRCDVTRGHHTWVDIDNRADTNPEGLYAWWYQDMEGKKGIRIMDRFGEPTGQEVFWELPSGTHKLQPYAWTVPFSAVNNAIPPSSGPATPLRFIPKYVTAAAHRSSGNHPTSLPFSVKGFYDDGKLHEVNSLRPDQDWYLHAVGSIRDHSVYLYSPGVRCPPSCSSREELWMAVRLNERPSVVTPPNEPLQ